MKNHQGALYNKDEADFLQEREALEALWKRDNQPKFSLLLENLGSCQRLEVNPGSGSFF